MFGLLSKLFLEEPEAEEPVNTNPFRSMSNRHRIGRDCVLILDASGSMARRDWRPSRLEGAKQASKEFCRQLSLQEPDAGVAIISYGYDAVTHCPLTEAKNVSQLEKAIDGIREHGATNMKAGLKEALQVLSHSHGECQIVFLSDGENTGSCPVATAEKLREIAVIECVGIGGSPSDVDEALLRSIASSYPDGTKRYRWIGDKQRLVKHFQELAGRITRS